MLHTQAFLEPVQRGLHLRHVKIPNRPKGVTLDLRRALQMAWGHLSAQEVGHRGQGRVGHRLQMTRVKRGDSRGWDVIREGIYVILAEGRVRKKHGGLVMARVKHSQSFLDGP